MGGRSTEAKFASSPPKVSQIPNFLKFSSASARQKKQIKNKTLGLAQTHEEIISSTFYTFATCGRPPKWAWEGRKASGILFIAINSLKPQRSPKKPFQAFQGLLIRFTVDSTLHTFLLQNSYKRLLHL